MRRLIPCVLLITLTGCMVGPTYQRPDVAPRLSNPFVETHPSTLLSDAPATETWWTLFQDPILDRLIQDALAHSTDIRVATANLRQARAALSGARAGRLPTTALSAGYSHNQVGADSLALGAGLAPATPNHEEFDYYQVGFDTSYEVDLFGRVGRSIEAAKGDYQGATAALDDVRVSVVAEVARDYADACGFGAQADVARETVQLQDQTLGLTERRLQAGRGVLRDVDQASELVEQAKAETPALEAERRASLYALAVLTGRPPEDIDQQAGACRTVPSVATPIPVGDGAALLARRPDVRKAERALAADTARIGVATAELYPSITLAGSVNLGAPRTSDLGGDKALGYSLGPLVSWTVPNIVTARSHIAQAKGRADASLANFDGAVLSALKEVEQALARYAASREQNAALARETAAADDAARLSRVRFDQGRDNFLDLLVAEQNRDQARTTLAKSNQVVAEAQVALFKALGGGWEGAPAAERRQPQVAAGGALGGVGH